MASPSPDNNENREISVSRPATAEEIERFNQTQAELSHRRKMEERDLTRSNWGLGAGFVVAMYGLTISLVLGLKGHDTAAIAIAGIDFFSLVGTFIYGANNRRD